jgi:outer membrane protein assembly factor BamD
MFKYLCKFILFILICSCASEKPEGKTEAEILFKEAKMLMDDGRYIMATEKLNLLRSQYPYSFFATPAELMLADILFMQENYVEAAAAYILFRDFHPKSTDTEYVIFKTAESYYKQIPDTHDRDLGAAFEAIKYYKELLEKFPQSKYVGDTIEKIKSSQRMIEEKEQYIADFYFKTKNFKAAKYRYLKIIRELDNVAIVDHAMKRVVLSAHNAEEYAECKTYADKFFNLLSESSKKDIMELIEKCKNAKSENVGANTNDQQ